MNYQAKKKQCPLCKGQKKVAGSKAVFVLGGSKEMSLDAMELAEAMANDDDCPHCDGVGEVSAPPYNDGSTAKMSNELMRELAKAGTLIRCIDEKVFVQAVANQAARIELPDEMADTYVAYWNDRSRDVTLGQYIFQIAQSAEELALNTFGDLGNALHAGPRKFQT